MRGAVAAMWSSSSCSTAGAGALFHRRLLPASVHLPRFSPSSRLLFPPRLSRSLFSALPLLRLKAADPPGRRRSGFSFRAGNNVSEPGSIDSSMILSMQSKIKEELEAESVVVKDAYGDGRHVSIAVVSKLFDGKSAVNRQRMVYKAIWEELQTTVHAVDQMTTLTPDEAGPKP